jgi:lipopolysaccharide biosynthesis glycosyltransferase
MKKLKEHRKTSSKKTISKKTSAKKTSSKKTSAKKTSAKKTSAKKTSSKKTSAKIDYNNKNIAMNTQSKRGGRKPTTHNRTYKPARSNQVTKPATSKPATKRELQAVKLPTDKHTKYAFVFLMFGGDNYLAGVLTAAYSILRNNTSYDIVCMITDDVSEKAIGEMKKLSIIPIRIPYLEYDSKPLLSKRQNQLYSKWANKGYTKWNCLALIQYEQVLFIDADMIILKNIDDVFDSPAPMGIFENPIDDLHMPNGGITNYYRTERSPPFGEEIKSESIKRGLNNSGFVITAACVKLAPNLNHYNGYQHMMNELQPFGFKSNSMLDEQSIVYYMSLFPKGPKLTWNNLTIKYAFNLWKYLDKKQNRCDMDLRILDFVGEFKPWFLKRDEFRDLEFWYATASEMVKTHPDLDMDFIPIKYKEGLNQAQNTDVYYKYFDKRPE